MAPGDLDDYTKAFIEQAQTSRLQPRVGDLLASVRDAASAFHRLGYDREEVAEVRDVRVRRMGAPDVPVRLYRPRVTGTPPLVVCVHGGSWVSLSVAQADEYYRVLANRSGCVLAAVDYRLAPESRFPAAIEEVHAAARWAARVAGELGCDPQRLGILGESSGGNQAAAATLLARDRGDVTYAQQILILPVLDVRLSSPSWERFGTDYLLTRDHSLWAIDQYAPGVDRTNPLLSPLCAKDFSGLPPALIFTAEYDPLRDDGERYAAALARAGVAVEHRCVDGLIHPALAVPKAIPLAARVLDDIGSAIRRSLAVRVP